VSRGSPLFRMKVESLLAEAALDEGPLKEAVKAFRNLADGTEEEMDVNVVALLIVYARWGPSADLWRRKFAPIVCMLPTDLSKVTPIAFSSSDLLLLQGTRLPTLIPSLLSTQLVPRVRGMFRVLSEGCCDILKELLPNTPTDEPHGKAKGWPTVMGEDRLLWALLTALRSTTPVTLAPGERSISVLVPGLDMISRGSPNAGQNRSASLAVVVDRGVVEVPSPYDFDAGDSVTLPIWSTTTAQHFLWTGEFIANLPNDCAEFSIDYTKFPPTRVQAIIDFAGVQELPRSFCGTATYNAGAFLAVARCLAMSDTEFQPNDPAFSPNKPASDRTELRMYKILQKRIKKQLDSFPMRPYEQLSLYNKEEDREDIAERLEEGAAEQDERFQFYLRHRIHENKQLSPHQRSALHLREAHRLLLDELLFQVERALRSFEFKLGKEKARERIARIKRENGHAPDKFEHGLFPKFASPKEPGAALPQHDEQ